MTRDELREKIEEIVEAHSHLNGYVAKTADAILALLPQCPEGWKLVPKEADFRMVSAGGHANSEWLNDNAPIGEARYALPMKSVWEAMIAAAPPETDEG